MYFKYLSKNTPHTFISDTTDDGKSLAIIRNETNSSYDVEKGTYKTERVVVIETEERLVSVDSALTQLQEELSEDDIQTPEENEDIFLEIPVPTEPVLTEVMPTPTAEKEMLDVETTTEVIEETEITETLPVEEAKTTWWETYQQEKESETVPTLKCPCEDPNDPCLHCIEK